MYQKAFIIIIFFYLSFRDLVVQLVREFGYK